MKENKEYLDHLRHSVAHLLAAAVMQLWPNTKRTIGPAIENGLYFDFDFGDVKISEEDFPKIEAKMREILKGWDKFEGREVSKDEAIKLNQGNEYKIELINEFAQEDQKITFYKSGDYEDLCRGGHLENPKEEIKAFKLLSVAGAYWRGSEKNKMLTRIYATAFPTQKELDNYLNMLEEAKKRDHRKIAQDLELYFIDEMVGKGLIMWLPNGTIVKDQVENYAKEMEEKGGYVRVSTPHIAKEELFLTSGHLPYYKDSMYPPMEMDDGTYYLKAMNCPHHHRIFLSKPRSYKQMPLRLAEYGTVYRNELSGTLAGLLRVRGLAMNDAHIYCTKDQIKDEFKSVMQLTMKYFESFGLKDYWFRLSKWSKDHPEKYINEPKNWEESEAILREILEELKVKYIEAEDEAAFYGPKVDIQFTSVIGRVETMSTIQLDFLAKERFGLEYIDESGKKNNEVFVIHRAPLSTHERFMAFLIEHFAGNFPLWLHPEQVAILPISGEKHLEYAQNIHEKLKLEGIRVILNSEAETLGNRIRKAQDMKIPYVVVLGDKEKENKSVNIRLRGGESLGEMSLEEFIKRAKEKIESKTLDL